MAERTASGYFFDVEWNRDELARYGLSMQEAQAVVENAIGGDNVTTTVEGRERYPVNVRYARELRDDVEKLKRVLVPVGAGMGASAGGGMEEAGGRRSQAASRARRRREERRRRVMD